MLAESPKLFLVAGEASGDLLGGTLLEGLRTRFPGLVSLGAGGTRMIATGMRPLVAMNELSVIGLAEVIKRLPRLLRAFRTLVKALDEERPHLLVTIDLPDFNFLLARAAKRRGIPVVHYVSPQVWAWRPQRVFKVARLVDHLLALFPFEPPLYAGTGLPVTFVGHPLVAAAHPRHPREAVRLSLGLTPGERLVTLLPGSRTSEILRLLPTMAASCRLLLARDPTVRFALAVADSLDLAALRAAWPLDLPVTLRQGETYDLLAAADAALITSGTATLEAALLETPMVVIYRVNEVTYWLGRRLIRVPFIALANLVAGRGLVRERIQGECRPDLLAADLAHLLDHPEETARLRRELGQVREKLAGAEQSAVDVVGNLLANRLKTGAMGPL